MTGYIHSLQSMGTVDGPGVRAVVFASGCPLRCIYCQNPDTWLCREEQTTSVETLYHRIKRLIPYIKNGGVTFSGGEPLLQAEFAGELADALHRNGISVAVETAGGIEPERFRRLLKKLDFIYIDLKHYDSACHSRETGIGNERILENIRTVKESGLPFILRIPVIPGFNDTPEDAGAFARLLFSMGIDRVQLLPFHQLGEKKYDLLGKPYAFSGFRQLRSEDLKGYQEVFRQHGVHAEI